MDLGRTSLQHVFGASRHHFVAIDARGVIRKALRDHTEPQTVTPPTEGFLCNPHPMAGPA